MEISFDEVTQNGIQCFLSCRGVWQLPHDGYLYVRERLSEKADTEYWKCQHQKKLCRCKARVKSTIPDKNGVVQKCIFVGEHLCRPDEVDLKVRENVSKLREHAIRSPAVPVSSVYQEIVNQMDEETMDRFPPLSSIASSLYRLRNIPKNMVFTSDIWNYFKRSPADFDVAACLECGVEVKRTGRATGRLIVHLRMNHPELYEEFFDISTMENDSIDSTVPLPTRKKPRASAAIVISTLKTNSQWKRPKPMAKPTLIPSSSKSTEDTEIWKFFDLDPEGKSPARCKKCKTVVLKSRLTHSIAPFKKHLKTNHSKLYNKYMRSVFRNRDSDVTCDLIPNHVQSKTRSVSEGSVNECSDVDKATMLDYALNEIKDADGDDVLLLSDAFWDVAAEEKITDLPADQMKKIFRDELLPALPTTTLMNKPERDFMLSVIPARYRHIIEEGKADDKNGDAKNSKRDELAQKIKAKARDRKVVAMAKPPDAVVRIVRPKPRVKAERTLKEKCKIISNRQCEVRYGNNGAPYVHMAPVVRAMRGEGVRKRVRSLNASVLTGRKPRSKSMSTKRAKASIKSRIAATSVKRVSLPNNIKLPPGTRKPRAEMMSALDAVLNGNVMPEVASMQFGVSFTALKSILYRQQSFEVSHDIQTEVDLIKVESAIQCLDDEPCSSTSSIMSPTSLARLRKSKLRDLDLPTRMPKFAVPGKLVPTIVSTSPGCSSVETNPAVAKAVHSVLQVYSSSSKRSDTWMIVSIRKLPISK